MELDIKKVFKSPFSEEKWYMKLIFPFIVMILSSPIFTYAGGESPIISLSIIILSFILAGFYAQFGHNEIHDISPLLPELESNIGNFFKYGFKLSVIMSIYLLLVEIGLFLLFVGASTSPNLASIAFILIIIGMIIGFPLSIIAQGIFFDNFSFKEAFNVKKILQFLPKVKKEAIVYTLFTICFVLLSGICNALVKISGFTVIFTAAFLTIFQLAVVNFNAQIYKIAKLRLE